MIKNPDAYERLTDFYYSRIVESQKIRDTLTTIASFGAGLAVGSAYFRAPESLIDLGLYLTIFSGYARGFIGHSRIIAKNKKKDEGKRIVTIHKINGENGVIGEIRSYENGDLEKETLKNP